MFKIGLGYAITNSYYVTRSIAVSFNASLDFSDSRNSQYYHTLIY